MGLGPGITGPFSGRVYRNTNGQVTAYRFTTSQRRVGNATKQVFYTAVDKVTFGIGGTLLSMGESMYSYFQNPSSEASREAGLSSVGLLASSSGNVSSAIANEVPEATRSIFSNSGKTLSNIGKGISLLSIYTALTAPPTRGEIIEQYSFQYAEQANGAYTVGQGLLRFPEGSDPNQITSQMNAIYNTIDSYLVDFDLSTNSGVDAANRHLQENISAIIREVNRLLKEQEQEQ